MRCSLKSEINSAQARWCSQRAAWVEFKEVSADFKGPFPRTRLNEWLLKRAIYVSCGSSVGWVLWERWDTWIIFNLTSLFVQKMFGFFHALERKISPVRAGTKRKTTKQRALLKFLSNFCIV